MNNMDRLRISDLQDLESFKVWIRNALNDYKDDKIPSAHLLIYLNHIEGMVTENNNIDKNSWLELIRNLESKVSAIKRVEVENEL